MKRTIIKPMSHKEWLSEREKGIGASEIGAILGISPFESPFSLWLKKTHQVEPEPENLAMKMGHLLEGVVVQLWEEETGEKVIKSSAANIIYVHPEYDFMRATPDRVVRGKKKILECKSTVTQIDPDNLPPHWVTQVIYQQYVTGIHDADLAWLVSGRYFGYAHIPYDSEFAEFIATRVKEFWFENVIGGKEPALLSVFDFDYKGSKPGRSIEADGVALEDIWRLRKVNTSIAELATEQEDLKCRIKRYMQDAETITFCGETLATWKSGKKGRVFLLKKEKQD